MTKDVDLKHGLKASHHKTRQHKQPAALLAVHLPMYNNLRCCPHCCLQSNARI
jgi:hypothetical protein